MEQHFSLFLSTNVWPRPKIEPKRPKWRRFVHFFLRFVHSRRRPVARWTMAAVTRMAHQPPTGKWLVKSVRKIFHHNDDDVGKPKRQTCVGYAAFDPPSIHWIRSFDPGIKLPVETRVLRSKLKIRPFRMRIACNPFIRAFRFHLVKSEIPSPLISRHWT